MEDSSLEEGSSEDSSMLDSEDNSSSLEATLSSELDSSIGEEASLEEIEEEETDSSLLEIGEETSLEAVGPQAQEARKGKIRKIANFFITELFHMGTRNKAQNFFHWGRAFLYTLSKVAKMVESKHAYRGINQ